MPGLVPGIHVLKNTAGVKDVDGRDTPGTKCPGAAMTTRKIDFLVNTRPTPN
jgi:hypothetical protein